MRRPLRTLPRKKVRAKRSYRHAVKQALKNLDAEDAQEEVLGTRRKSVHRNRTKRPAALKAERRRLRAKRYRRRAKSRAELIRERGGA